MPTPSNPSDDAASLGPLSVSSIGLTDEQIAYLGMPPKPHPPSVALVGPGGLPTKAFHDYLTQQYEWERRLYTVLTE